MDDYHGVKVADPYRWLEDPDSQRDRAPGSTAENKVTSAFLEGIPEREPIRKRLTELWNYERFSVPAQQGGRYFFTRNDGLQNQGVLYTASTPSRASRRLVLDPNTLSQDGTVALTGWNISEDGKLLAYGLAAAGSDWQEWRVRDVATGQDLPDTLKWVKFSEAAWTHDNKGFFYSRYDEPREGRPLEEANFYQKLYYHRLGTPQTEDELVYQRPRPEGVGFIASVTEDGRYLVIHVWKGTDDENGIFYKDLDDGPGSEVVELLERLRRRLHLHRQRRPGLLVPDRSRRAARPGDRDRSSATRPREVERADPAGAETLQAVTCWATGSWPLPEGRPRAGAACSSSTASRARGGAARARHGGGVQGKLQGQRDVLRLHQLHDAGDDLPLRPGDRGRRPSSAAQGQGSTPASYETRQVFYTSKDGTRVPMFLTHKKG